MYKAFISYSHAADGRLAPALQSALERFAKPWYKVRYFNVFRDEASLSANPHLWTNIQAALEKSEFLIYMASPGSAASKWVQKEIEFWIENKSINNLLIVLTEGDIVWEDESKSFANADRNSLPAILEKKFTEEPFYIDLRQIKTQEDLSLHNPLFKKEILKLAAPLHGKEPKDLAGEEVTAHRKMMRIRNAAIGILALLFVIACGAAWLANKNKNEAIKERNIAQANYLISEAKGAVETDPVLALRLAEQAILLNKDTTIEKAAMKIYRENSFNDIHYLKNYETSENDALSVAFSPDQKTILVGSWTINDSGNVRLLDLKGNLIKEIINFPFGITAVAFSPDGKSILAGSTDGMARLWDLNGNLKKALKDHSDQVNSVAFSPDGKTILTGSKDKTARLWNPEGNILYVLKDYNGAVNAVAFSPDGKTILTGSDDGGCRLWQLNGNMIQEFKGHDGPVKTVAFSPDGKMILTGSDNGTPYLWDLKGNILQEFKTHEYEIGCMAFSPDGKAIFIGSRSFTGNIARLWDLNGNIIKEYRNLLREPNSVTFSSDGKTILIDNSFPCLLDAPLSLGDFLKSDKIPQLSMMQRNQFGIR